jgi:hypothetical protein
MTKKQRREYLNRAAVDLNGLMFDCPSAHLCVNVKYRALATELFRALRSAYADLDAPRRRRKVKA